MDRPILWIEVKHGSEGYCARLQCVPPDLHARPPIDPNHCGNPACRWLHSCVGCGEPGHGLVCCPVRSTESELASLRARVRQ
eukprot:8126678-Lingulodinium_polyedra.AAC.1